jgi:protein TonB
VKTNPHQRAEVLAGAITLGEATDAERHEYREHIAACRSCLDALGGEQEFERLASVVAEARDSEIWEPDVRPGLSRRAQRPSRLLRFGLSAIGTAFVLSIAVHAAIVNGVGRITTASNPVVINAGSTRIVLEQRPPVLRPQALPQVQAPSRVSAAPRHMTVVHNVVQIARAPVSAPVQRQAEPQAASPREVAAVTVHPASAGAELHAKSRAARVPSWHTVAMTTTTALSESAPAPLQQKAESLQMSMVVAPAYATREAAPLGGETAINPQVPMIAYDEGAQGTTVFEVQMDERGIPQKCTITRSSGFPVLDNAVCKAAMGVKYAPKTVNGRPVPGSYTDAFTFRMNNDTEKVLPDGTPGQP